MPDPLHRLAADAEADAFFLGGLLAAFARSEDMDDAALAVHLGCPVDQLSRLKLCRAPRAELDLMRQDLDRIAGHFGLSEPALRQAVLRGRVVLRLRQGGDVLLMAARDRETQS
jgi:hypothetical protein